MYDPIQKRVVKSGDVVIDESKTWNWDEYGERSGEKVTVIELETAQGIYEQVETPIAVEPELPGAAGPVRRLERDRQRSFRLDGYDLLPDSAITAEGDLIHFTLLVEAKPMSLEQPLKHLQWK